MKKHNCIQSFRAKCVRMGGLKKIPLAMRTTLFMLFCVVGILSANEGYAQKTLLNITSRNKMVSEVLNEIEQKTEFTFFYNNKQVDVKRRVSVQATSENVFKVLDKIFSGTDVVYKVLDKSIILSNTAINASMQQQGSIRGKVVDANGEPVIGANVIVVGTSKGAITDVDGNFSVEASKGDVIKVSYIGYLDKTVTVANRSTLQIVLQEDTKTLDEVVVIGYGTQTKKSLTGAVGTMDMGDIEASTVTSISHAMGGKVAGLRVNLQSAQPGGAAKFRIRGEASTGAGNDPLIVIDGFPVGSSSSLESGNDFKAGDTDNILESLNPDDIESISVLKDAASTAIYGARAGHGVVLITTKRGKAGKPKVTYTASGSFQNIRANYDILNARDYMRAQNMHDYERYQQQNGLGIYKGYIPTKEVDPYTPKYSDEQIAKAVGTDWLDKVTRTGWMQQHNLSINGGGDKTKYMASFNYMNQEGVVKNNGATRISARLNLDQEINKYISVGLTASYSQNRYDNVPLGDGDNENAGILVAAVRANPTIPVYDEDGNYSVDPSRATFPNPVSLLDITDETVKDRLMGNAFVIIKPVKGLELKGTFGADRRMQKRRNYLPKTTLAGANKNGWANVSYEDATDYLMDLTATYNTTIKEDHVLKALVGYSYQQFNTEGVNAGNQDFLIDAFKYHNLAAGNYAKPSVGSYASKNSMGSYFARINYQYRNRYLLEATIRADGAANFDPDNRWGFFPSVSAGWVISEEKFMESTRNWLSNLKLRASYGQTGNSNIGNRIHTFYATGDANHNYVFGGSLLKGVYVSELGNPNLTWETTSEFNIGLDLGFLNDRIRLTAEYFNRRITDILVKEKPLMFYNEVTKIADNAGSTQSQGFELTLNTVNFRTRDFDWNTTLTLSRYKDRWLTRPDTWKPEKYEKKDDPIRAWWAHKSLGMMKPGEQAPKAQSDLLPGQVILWDKDDSGSITNDDKVYMGSGDPKIIYGFNNALRYKRFDFNIYFYGEAGREADASYYENWTKTNNNSQNMSYNVFNAFNSNNQSASHPSLIDNAYGVGDYYVKSIYYIRCGSITLGYNVPVSKKWISNLRVYADVNNPFIITNWTGLDPETDLNTYNYPNVTSYSLGLSITF